MFEKLHFHSHPGMEKIHKIPNDHVIIDQDAYNKVLFLIMKEREKIRETFGNIGCIMKDQSHSYPRPIIRLYPNKFEIITHENQATKPGLYYINEGLTDALKESLSLWISDLMKEKRYVMCNQYATIDESDFCRKYDYPVDKLSWRQGVCYAKRDYYINLRLNPIRVETFLDAQARISLWGSYVKGLNQKDLLSVKLAHDYSTLEHMAVIMSLLEIILKEGTQVMWNCLDPLKAMRWIYRGYRDGFRPNLVNIFTDKTSSPYIIDLSNKEGIEHDLKLLKSYFIKE